MIRLLLFMYIPWTVKFTGIAKTCMASSAKRLIRSFSGFSSGTELIDDQLNGERILEHTPLDQKLVSPGRNNQLSTPLDYFRQKTDIIIYNDINLFSSVRNGPVWLSVLRL